jgi:hypothetical protein
MWFFLGQAEELAAHPRVGGLISSSASPFDTGLTREQPNRRLRLPNRPQVAASRL